MTHLQELQQQQQQIRYSFDWIKSTHKTNISDNVWISFLRLHQNKCNQILFKELQVCVLILFSCVPLHGTLSINGKFKGQQKSRFNYSSFFYKNTPNRLSLSTFSNVFLIFSLNDKNYSYKKERAYSLLIMHTIDISSCWMFLCIRSDRRSCRQEFSCLAFVIYNEKIKGEMCQ